MHGNFVYKGNNTTGQAEHENAFIGSLCSRNGRSVLMGLTFWAEGLIIKFGKAAGSMKIEIITDENADDLKISVTCRQLSPEVEKLIAVLRMTDHQLTGRKNDEIHLLDIARVIYIESVDRKCFIYTAEDIYESELKLYELERQLEEYGFFRVSKSVLIHLHNVQSLKADINRRIRITMSNGEQIIASRQYADKLKKRLGVI